MSRVLVMTGNSSGIEYDTSVFERNQLQFIESLKR
jgi:hypothetical protein